MRVLLDGYWWVEGPFSNRQVQRELIRAWAQGFPEDELAIAVPRAHRAAAIQTLPPAARLYTCRLRPHGAAAAVEMPVLARRFRADVTITHNFAPITGRSAIFLHDVLFQSNPEWFTRAERLYFSLMPILAPRAEVVFSSSRTEAERIRRHNRRIRRVVPVGLSIGTDLATARPEPPAGVTADGFFLSVARLNVRKNLALAIDAALDSGTPTPEQPLVIVGEEEGKAAQLSARVRAALAQRRVRLLTRVSSAELAWLYQHARALLFPSLDEGFGLPPVEALYFGCPVIASDIAVLRETLGPYATFVDPLDRDAWRQAITSAASGPGTPIDLPADYLTTWPQAVALMRQALT